MIRLVIPNPPISVEQLQFLSSEAFVTSTVKLYFFIFKHDERETNETRKDYYSEKRDNALF